MKDISEERRIKLLQQMKHECSVLEFYLDGVLDGSLHFSNVENKIDEFSTRKDEYLHIVKQLNKEN